ncbi:MAG: hypothetical protein H6650_20125 [Ardenticatenales bacterium]|nr:hypothetical protein [Ardenticatenales bacterium]
MAHNSFSIRRLTRHMRLWWALVLALALGVTALVQAQNSATPGGTPPFFSADGTLAGGQSIAPVIPLFSGTRGFNFSLTVSGDEPLSLNITDGAGEAVWSGEAQPGETLWGSGTLTTGNNTFNLSNNGSGSSDFLLNVFDLPTAAYTWTGTANGSGLFSSARVHFPASGLYTFDLGVAAGRYQFWLDDEYIQKTAEADTSVSYFVSAGIHTLTITQDSGSGAAWSVDISNPGAVGDSLPYSKSGGDIGGNGNDFDSEWLPLHLGSATQVNIAVTLAGSAGDNLTLDVYDPDGLTLSAIIYADETRWVSVDLPAGNSRLHFSANPANGDPLGYDFVADVLPAPDYTWSGVSDDAGEQSHARVDFATAGLYTFDLGVAAGRYQFWLDDEYILKTAEADTSVTYYVPAGIHDFMLWQDTGSGATWSVSVTLAAAANDTLPYNQVGGDIGGSGNDFYEEWLPISLDAAATVNLRLEATGDGADALQVDVYQAGSSEPDAVVSQVLGGEILWANFALSAGINRLHITTADNTTPLQYDLTLSAMPTDGIADWAGSSRDAGLNSAVIVNFPADGIYRFDVSSDPGFVNLALDDFLPAAPRQRNSTSTGYERPVTAGAHVITVLQDSNFPVSTWSASVTPVTPTTPANFFTFQGDIAPGDTIVPTYPLVDDSLAFNFAFTVLNSGPVDLTMRNGADIIWSGQAEAGETLWGTADLLNGINQLLLTNNGDAAAAVTLNFYELPTAPYTWSGEADASGLNSHIRVIFPTDGLYDFDLGVNTGRYQLLVNDEYIQKTAEASTGAAYRVMAGVQDVYVVQDSGEGASWQAAITPTGALHDDLPYMKEGGDLGGLANDFDTEWMPVSLAAATQVNVALTLSGIAGNNATLTVYNEAGEAVADAGITVWTGETQWFSVDLPAGTSRLQLMADEGNRDPLTYDLTIDTLPTPAYTWDGLAVSGGASSQARVSFANDGLYAFDLGVDSGRYQFLLDDAYMQKTAEADTSVVYFVSAGIHNLTLIPDSGTGADWDVAISDTGIPLDTLPYQKEGGLLGGAENEFSQEWLPLNLDGSGTTPANLEISVSGDNGDALKLEVYDALSEAVILTLDPIYGGETLWATVDIPTAAAGGARLRLAASAANSADLAYDLTIHAQPQLITANDSYHWSGLSLADGLNAALRLNTVISGVYQIQVALPTGFAAIYVDSSPTNHRLAAPTGFYYEFDAPFAPGEHTFITDQDTNFAETAWTITATLMMADAPALYTTSADSGSDMQATPLTLTGFNIMPGAMIELVKDDMVFALMDVTYGSATSIDGVVPASLPAGVYDIVLTNPDGQQATLSQAYEVFHPIDYLFLPTVFGSGG